jgi:hypothetical protein
VTSPRRIAPIVLVLVGAVVTPTDAQPRPRAAPPAPVVVVPAPVVVPWWYVPPPLPYDFYVQQELAKRWPPRPSATQSFDGVSPRCPRFFCEEVAR